MAKKPHIFYLVIFGISILIILSLNLYIGKENQKRLDREVATELIEEQKVQGSIRNYIMALKWKDIEKYNSVVADSLKINTQSLFFTRIMSNVIDAKFIGDNLSVIHLKSSDRATSLQVKYEISFDEQINPEGIYTSGKNKCKVSFDLIKTNNKWIITQVYDIKIV